MRQTMSLLIGLLVASAITSTALGQSPSPEAAMPPAPAAASTEVSTPENVAATPATSAPILSSEPAPIPPAPTPPPAKTSPASDPAEVKAELESALKELEQAKNPPQKGTLIDEDALPVKSRGVRLYLGAGLGIEIAELDEGIALGGFSPRLNLGLWIKDRVDIRLGVGTYLQTHRYYYKNLSAEYTEEKLSLGQVMIQVGVRALLIKPRIRHATVVIGVDTLNYIGIVKGYDSSRLWVDELEEQIDRFALTAVLGIEYLLSDNFGIAVETGLSWTFNGLEDEGDSEYGVTIHRNDAVTFQIPFSMSFLAHF